MAGKVETYMSHFSGQRRADEKGNLFSTLIPTAACSGEGQVDKPYDEVHECRWKLPKSNPKAQVSPVLASQRFPLSFSCLCATYLPWITNQNYQGLQPTQTEQAILKDIKNPAHINVTFALSAHCQMLLQGAVGWPFISVLFGWQVCQEKELFKEKGNYM